MKDADSTFGARSSMACAVAALVACSGVATADQWFLTPTASLGVFFDDNIRLAIRDPEESFAAVGDAKLAFGRRTEVSELGIGVHLSSTRHSEVQDLDRTDGGLSLESAYQLGRHRLGLAAGFDYDSTLTSEVSTSGWLQTNKRRSRWSLNPSWRYTLSERSSLEADVSYQDVSYEDAGRIALYDYSFAQASTTGSYALTERFNVLGRLSYDQYDAAQVDTASESYGIELGTSYLLSETMTLSTFAGVRHTKSEIPTWWGYEDDESDGPLFQVAWRDRYEQGDFAVTALRSMMPSGNGTLLDTTGITVALTRSLSPLWSVRFNAEGYRNQVSGSESSSDDRKYLSFSPTISRRLTEAWSVDLSYRYRWQRYDVNADSATSDAVYITVRYSGMEEPLNRWSRLGGG